MVFQEYKPSLILSEFIRTFRLVHYDYKRDGLLPFKAYPPRPEHCLSFYARELENVEYQDSGTKAGNLSTVLFGHQTEVTKRFVGNELLLIQVIFKPGSLYRLTGIPSNHITNQYIDAETVFSKEIKYINDKINDCKTFIQMIQVVEAFLLNEIKRNLFDIHSLDITTSNIFTSKRIPSVEFLAKTACQSIRNFERQFNLRMGVSPKYYLKVMRFEYAYSMKNKSPHLDWLTIAIYCGYYDYQHLARDYKDLTGLTPNQFHEIDLRCPKKVLEEVHTNRYLSHLYH